MQNTTIMKVLVVSAVMMISCSLSGCASTPCEQNEPTTCEGFIQEIHGNTGVYGGVSVPSHGDIKDAVLEKWAIYKETRGPLWVEYNEGYTARSIINVVAGYAVIEALVENDSEEAKKAAWDAIQHQMLAANTQCQRYLGFEFLSGLDGKVEVTTMANLPKEAFPQLYPVREKKAPIEVSSSGPKSYLEEMQRRNIDLLAQTAKTNASENMLSAIDADGFDYATALSQYVAQGKKTNIKPKSDIKVPHSIERTHINATSELPPDMPQKVQAQSVLSVKVALPYNHVQIASEQHKNTLYEYSAVFGLVPNIMYAIMHTESYFNPFARSYSPAYGLMQLVPNSGGKDAYTYLYHEKWKPSPDYLYNPDNNIELGTAYFSKVKDVYFKGIHNEHNAYIATIAAYNTGPGNVAKAIVGKGDIKKAIRIINTLTPQKLYDVLQKYLPYQETKDYLNYVMSRSELYYEK